MDVISDTFIDLLTNQFFIEDKYIRTNKTNKDWRQVNRPIQPREIRSHFTGNYYIGFICRDTPIKILAFDLDYHSDCCKKTLKTLKLPLHSYLGKPSSIRVIRVKLPSRLQIS